MPKKPDDCSPRGFRARGAPDVGALGWEEFVKNDRPFAFHIGSIHAADNRYLEALSIVVEAFNPAQKAVVEY